MKYIDPFNLKSAMKVWNAPETDEIPKCPKCGTNSEVVDAYRCFACNEWFEE